MRINKKIALVPFAVSMGTLVAGATVFACTNYVGTWSVWGNNTGYGATPTVATGNQPADDPSQAMTQSVSATVSKVSHGSGTDCTQTTGLGCIKVKTAPRSDNGWHLNAGAYDLNVINMGYDNHTTWSNPNGDCMSWRGAAVNKLGTLTITGTGGLISSATDNATPPNAVTVTNNVAGPFKMPSSYTANTGTQEAGVCISDSLSVNGNQVPVTVI